MKNFKKILFNILGCVLFLFVGGITLGIIIDDNELAYSICLKIVLGYAFIYLFILSLNSLIKRIKETAKEIKKQNVKMIIRPITWSITIFPYIILWGILTALISIGNSFSIFSIAATVVIITAAIYILIVLIVGSKFTNDVYKEIDKEDVEDLEKYIKNKDKE